MTVRESEQGFSLIETLVALAVISIMAGMAFEAIGANARFADNLAKRREATLLAQSLLAEASVPQAPGATADQGRAAGLAWNVSRRSMGGGARDSGIPLEEVRVTVMDRSTGGRLVQVRTLRLVR